MEEWPEEAKVEYEEHVKIINMYMKNAECGLPVMPWIGVPGLGPVTQPQGIYRPVLV